MLSPDVARVKVWNAEGKILYSDEPLLIGRRFPLGADELGALRGRTTEAEVADLTRPENTYERGMGDLTSVYLGLRAQDGTPVLYEEYLRSSAISGDSRSLVRRFAPVGIVALLVVAVLQIPLAWRMATPHPKRPARPRAAAAASDRRLRAGAPPDRGRPARRRRPGAGRPLLPDGGGDRAGSAGAGAAAGARRGRRRHPKRDPPAALAADRDLPAGAAKAAGWPLPCPI